MKRVISIGEAMLELSGAGDDLWRLGVAGDTMNTAWYLRESLSPDWQVDYLTRVGTDEFSHRVVNFLAEAGIGTAHVSRDPSRAVGLYAISLDKGERSFAYWRGQSAARHLADDANMLNKALDGVTLAYVSAITLAILAPDRRQALLDALATSKATVAFDTNYRPRLWEGTEAARDWITAAALVSDIVLPSADDDAACFGDASPEATLARYVGLGVGEIVVKSGGGPVLYFDGKDGRIDDLTTVTPVDTTGAGDSFSAGYLSARLTGANVRDAALSGHDLAMRVVQGPGALVPKPVA
ncbi:sugar kinase [Shimia biformata]|uniref:sugar kinase n=1 Tax=Shimia biformata TaxID=1294299 RepID=UPI0019521C9B|nr:sugar kinase [Shimia biformata]